MILFFAVSKGTEGIVDPTVPLLEPIPAGATDQTNDPGNPLEQAPASQQTAYTPGLGPAFDGNENSYVLFYTYSGGAAIADYDTPVTPVAVEVVVGGTRGYSGERGWFGGSGYVDLDGVKILDFHAEAVPAKSRWRATVSGVSGLRLRCVKPANARFRPYEMYLYI